MDPVGGPWSAYASYNRLAAGVQTGASGAELHHHLTQTGSSGTPATTTAQLLSTGFLSPPPVGYETVFTPLFHHASAKPPAHYVTQVTQHRQALAQAQAASAKQANESDYHQAQAFFEQSGAAWQQNSPFGILPHESVVPSTTSASKTGTATYENFNAHFVAAQSLNHLNSQLAAANVKNASRAQSPQVSNATIKSPATQTNSVSFFQSPSTYSGGASDTSNNNKSFGSSNSSNLQQSCIVSSSPNASVSRVPQSRTIYLGSPNPRTNEKASFTTPSQSKNAPLIQTKAQTKIYPELSNHTDRQRQTQTGDNTSQSSPISFSIMDAAGRLNYAGSNSSAKRPQFQHSSNYRHYQSGNNADSDFQRPKSSSDYSNSPDCNVVVPRRPSPLQAHSQASPLGHVPSPAYPMYNSPLNSISSPQNSNQVTPPSPLDVTVSRTNASQTGSTVAYPSVITRALNNDKSFTDRYERANQANCWDDRRKFSNQSNNTPINNNYNLSNSMEVAANRSEHSQHRNLTNDRQPSYFDSGQHQGALQDLSSCRGDPMSIVKNLQQQSCQVQQSEIKQEVKSATKRRKSNENKINNNASSDITGPTLSDYFAGRIPPPAHTANQQQQNGAYFDFDSRWIPPPTSSKIFGTQAAIHPQHQGLMVPHPHSHHPPPPLPYFTPFHLAPHPDFPQSVEISPITPYNEHHNQPSSSHFVQQENAPKVVVPNIEEELNFLSEGTTRIPSTATQSLISPPTLNNPPPQTSKSETAKGPSAGFMNSYLKFLQGERENSPPPASRGNRKQSWSRAKPFQQQQQPEVKQETNGVPLTPPPPLPQPVVLPTTITSTTLRLSQGDPQDDPRYFPLPKERKKNRFDSSDDGCSSDEDLFNKKVAMAVRAELPRERSSRKGRPPKAGGPTERKRVKQVSLTKKEKDDDGKDVSTFLPRRESSKRAAKEKTSMQQLIAKQTVDEDLEEPPEFVDSDSDPAWTPQARDDPEEDLTLKKGKKSKHSSRKRMSRSLINTTPFSIDDELENYSNDAPSVKKPKLSSNKQATKQNIAPTLEDNIAAAVAQQNNIPVVPNDDNPYKPGEFIVIKSELNQEWPAIWRVDGKSLLQKYEPYDLNGKTMYKNISTYTSWTPDSKKQYTAIPVKYHSQSQLESIVEFLRKEMIVIDYQFMEVAMKESEVFQDNFEVYIQTLISQALDSNFLTEIFQEQDEYFLTNVKTIDDITGSKKFKMVNMLRWPSTVQIAVTTWPCFNVIRELSAADTQFRSCAACLKQGVAVRVLMYGQPYNSTTLEGCQPSTQIVEKDFLMCRICASQIELFNKITHQKYLMYIECAKRVAEKRATEPLKDTTCILNELLADENWLTQLFNDVRSSWAEVDSLEHSYRYKNSIQ